MNSLKEWRSQNVTCDNCGKVGTLCHPNSDVRAFYFDGEHYYGSPIKRGSIIVQGNSCSSCVRAQGAERQALLSVMSSPRNYDTHPLRVNEMP